MVKVNPALEQAIVDKAMREPDFLDQLLADPQGCLKALATGHPRRWVRSALIRVGAPRVKFPH